jgi:hypothetical protein
MPVFFSVVGVFDFVAVTVAAGRPSVIVATYYLREPVYRLPYNDFIFSGLCPSLN